MFGGVYYVCLALGLREMCVSASLCASSSAWCGGDVEMKVFAAHRRAGSTVGLEVWQTEGGGAGMQHHQTEPTLTSWGYLNMR